MLQTASGVVVLLAELLSSLAGDPCVVLSASKVPQAVAVQEPLLERFLVPYVQTLLLPLMTGVAAPPSVSVGPHRVRRTVVQTLPKNSPHWVVLTPVPLRMDSRPVDPSV